MKLKALELSGFRNYRQCRLEFNSSINVFYGSNAQGKTNLLEAIYFLATARSPRTSRTTDLVGWGLPSARISGEVEGLGGCNEVSLTVGRDGRKQSSLNGKLHRRVSRLIGVVKAIFFMPDDLVLVKGGPGERRFFLDAAISQLDGAYLARLSRYQRALRHKNELLKRCAAGQTMAQECDVWDEQLAGLGAEIVARRWQATVDIAGKAAATQARISRERLEVRYRSSFLGELGADDGERLAGRQELARRALAKGRAVDIRRGYTANGPHADDLAIYLNGREIRDFASQGQQRTAVVALKMAMCDYFRQVSGEYPLLLLDDIASELDEERRGLLLDYLGRGAQVFISTTEEWKKSSRWPQGELFCVEAGRVGKTIGAVGVAG